jgi:hypothetical protein
MEHEVTCLTLAAVLPSSLIVHDSLGFRHMPGNIATTQQRNSDSSVSPTPGSGQTFVTSLY